MNKKKAGKKPMKKVPLDDTNNIEPQMFEKAFKNVEKLKVMDYGNDIMTEELPTTSPLMAQTRSLPSDMQVTAQARSMPSNMARMKISTTNQKKEVIKESSTPPAKLFDRKVLFDEYGKSMKDYFDLTKIPALKTQLEGQGDINLSFYGIEQLTDTVFLMLSHDQTPYNNVRSVDLTGCHRVTDHGIIWMTDAFPNLTKVILSGLYQVTETGVHYLVNNCPKLKNLALKGTSLTIMPIKIATQFVEIDMDGYPCISPETDMLKKASHGIQMLTASGYSKPEHVPDLVKMVVIQSPAKGRKSLTKYLKGEKSTEFQPLTVFNNVPFGPKFQVNTIECEEVLSQLFLTKRTLFVFPVYSDSDTAASAKKIFGYISYICTKVAGAAFIIAGISANGKEAPADAVTKELKTLVDRSGYSFYRRKTDGDMKAMLKGDIGKSFADQENLVRTVVLCQRLQSVHIDTVKIDMAKDFSASSDVGKKFETALQKVCQACPEVQDLASPMFQYALVGKIDSMMEGGVASMESLKASRVAIMDLMAVMGRVICPRILLVGNIVCSINWLSKLFNVAFVPPANKTQNRPMTNLEEGAPFWSLSELKDTLTKQGVENVSNGMTLLNQLGVGITNVGFSSFSALTPESFVPLDQFFPEYPDLQKKKDLFYTAGYQIEFNLSVPRLFMQRLIQICSVIRKPALIWERGFILQEACVETLFHLADQEKGGDGSTLTLMSHTVKNNKSSVTAEDIEQLVWNTLNTYKIVLKYVLQESCLPYNRKFIGQKATLKEGIVDLISGHMIKEPEEGSGSIPLCSKCGSNQKALTIPWVLDQMLMTSCLKETMCVLNTGEEQTPEQMDEKAKSRFSGNMLKVNPKEQYMLKSSLTVGQQSTVKFFIAAASGKKYVLGLGYHFNVQKRGFGGTVSMNLSNGAISGGSEAEPKVFGKCNPKAIPEVGDVVGFELKTGPTQNCELVITRNSEKIGSVEIPKRTYYPFIKAEEHEVTVMSYPVYNYVEQNEEVKKGMRLEALDIKNPSLMCVATIDEVFPDGKVRIHFDGWGNGYDYVAEPNFKDLHPVGWFRNNGIKSGKLRSQLQAPHNYFKSDFDWKRYLVNELNVPPVPFSWFTEEQIGDTSPDLLMEIASNFDVSSGNTAFSMACGRLTNRPKVYEYQVLKKSMMNPDLFKFFTNHNKFFCLLPSDLTLQTLRNPSLMSIMDFSKQNVHILCPGLKMELLHFVDSTGAKFTEEKSIEELAVYLQYCYSGLLLQVGTLPSNCTYLVKGFEELRDKDEGNTMMLKLSFLYQTVLEFLSHRQTNKEVKSPRVAIDIFNGALKSKELSDNLVTGTDANVKCRGHSMSLMTNKDLQEISMDDFKQFFPFMTKLEFANNHLEKLPDDFFKSFKACEVLNVSGNKLSKLPDGIKNLKDLTYLDVSSNNLTELPAELSDLAESMTYLDISDNPFNHLPVAIGKLVNLEDLLAQNIGVINDLSGILKLKSLVTLNLGLNKLSGNVDGLEKLPLTSLDLSGVPWFPVSMFQSYQAFILTLNANYVTADMTEKEKTALFKSADADMSSNLTPEEVISMNVNIMYPSYPRFGEGNLKYESTGGIPPCILQMKQLKRLVLRYHGIELIPDDVKNLTELSELDLSYNIKLKSLSAELGGISLRQIHLKDCLVLNTPPKEIVARGFLAIMGYLKRLRLGASPCRRTKLMMVGLGGAGKTSLVQALMNGRYRAYMDADEPITDGIDIKTWQVPIAGSSKDMLTYSVWDFAGQTVYYNTHQFFLSNRAVYLLLWNVRQGYEHAGLDFWLSSIACHAPKAPILVIGTHIDKVDKYKLPEEILKARYPQISGFYYISAYTGTGIAALGKEIIKLTLEQKYMGERIPEAWLSLEKKLIEYREEKEKDLLPLKTLAGIGSTCGIFDNTELVQAIQFLHDLGAVQFFNKDFLRDMVVIYPQWIIDVMACLVTVHEGAVLEGKLLLKDVSKVWNAYPTELHPWLLRLTEEFDLTCPLGDEEASIVPCLLPDEEPEYNWPHAHPEKNIRESMIIYKFQYLPAGLFNRAQVRMNEYSKGALIWKRGSFMKKNNHIALMLQTGDQEVVVRAQGFRPENFLFIVHEMIETLICESYGGVSYDFMVPCLDCLNLNVKDPSMISNSKVQRAMEMNVPFIQCDKFFHILSIQEVKDSMPSDKMSDMDNHLRSSVRELMDLTQETTINVFFIYTTKNVPELKDVEKMVNPGHIMEDLRKHGSFKVSYTDKPESSNMEALTLTVKSTNVVMIGMSDEFCDNPECKKLLLYIKDVLRLPVALVLLGSSKRWQKGELNMSFGAEVYVDMQNKSRYEHKIKELYDCLKKKAAKTKQVESESVAKCFISYCWSNSHDAISKGSRVVEGALGPWTGSDPREVKKFLDSKKIKCWLDVEKVGGTGLFSSIADGLREAEVMVAFVSNEYVNSKNCVMEFRYGLTTLRIPVLVVVVGTGYEWERSEVGLLAVGHKCSKINLQYNNETANLDILRFVQEKLKTTGEGTEVASSDNQRNVAFQEVLELTQRKFLRHITTSMINNDLQPYPSLFVVDFISDKEKEQWEKGGAEKLKRPKTASSSKTTDEEKAKADVAEDTSEPVEEKKYPSSYCFRLFCENPHGWHIIPGIIPFPELDGSDEQQLIDAAGPYIARLLAISKHSNVELQCLTTPEGEIFQQRIEEIGVKSASDFKDEYLELRETVMQQDKHKHHSHLSRCQANGKMVWLCDNHKKATRSKTEERYNIDIPIPKDELPENYIPAEEPELKPLEKPEKKAPKIFNRRAESKGGKTLHRQTSQACSVM